jgi:hypothetical protein
MTHRIRLALAVGVLFLGGAFAAAAATIGSPVRSNQAHASMAAKRAALGQESLDLDLALLESLRRAEGDVVVDGFPIALGSTARLVLHRFEVASADAHITVETAAGPSTLPLPAVTHFSGTLDGEPDSRVYIGVQKERIVAYIDSNAGTAFVGPDESGAGHVLRMTDSPLNAAFGANGFTCAEEDLPPTLEPASDAAPLFLPRTALAPDTASKQGAVRVDTDQELLAKFSGNIPAMAAYILSLFGQANVAYERDLSIHLTVVEIHAWTVADPYVGPSTVDQLNQVGAWWQANRPIATYPRWTVHLISGVGPSGGVAWLDVHCGSSTSYGYGVTQVYGSYSAGNPWDYWAIAHEIGHNAGSPHTHCMGPPTYPDWTDMCYGSESGCYSGPATNPGAGNGTIMSYCHLLGWQYVTLKFHPRCITDQMLPLIASDTACMTSGGAFADVPPSNGFFDYVEAVARRGVTSGCGNGNYCPDDAVSRQQMAVFLLKAEHGADYVPPGCGNAFADVACPSQYANWIEQLSAEGITTGCGNGSYCPNDPVTRQQMAVFLLKAEHGSAYAPPSCSSNPFPDVACPSLYANWIKQLVAEKVTGGCTGGNYCPTSPVTRAQMAAFLTKTFGLLTTQN